MATKYNIGAGNWASDTIWSTTSGGGNDTTHPVAGDDVIFDNASGAGTVTVAATGACKTLTFNGGTGYTGGFTVNAALTVSGALTLSAAAMTSGGTSVLICDTTATLTANGRTWTPRLSFRGTSQTFTLADAWVVTAAIDCAGSSPTVNGSTLRAGGLTLTTTGMSGTTVVTLSGGTWSGNSGMKNALTIDGDVTVSGSVTKQDGALTRSSGTVTTTGSTLTLSQGASTYPTLDTNGITWNNVVIAAAGGLTLTNNSLLTVGGTLTGPSGSITFGGSAGFTTATFANTAIAATCTYTFTYGNTYTVTTALTIAGIQASGRVLALASSDGTNHVVLTFSGASSPYLTWVNPTRIDSSGGKTIFTDGTIITSDNWVTASLTGCMWLA